MKVKIFSVVPGSMAWGDIGMPIGLERKVNDFLLSVREVISLQQCSVGDRLIVTILYK